MKSPCIQVCTLTPDGKQCTGCKRTPGEIMAWSSMTDAEREAIMARCLSNYWGSKCRECMSHLKNKQKAQLERELDDLGEALL